MSEEIMNEVSEEVVSTPVVEEIALPESETHLVCNCENGDKITTVKINDSEGMQEWS